MKSLEIDSSRLLMTNHVKVGHLIMYADLIARRFHKAIQEVIVAKIPLSNNEHIREAISPESRLILEGNHKSVAYALLRPKIPCLELENDDDLLEIVRRSSRGEAARFIHESRILAKIVNEGLSEARIQFRFGSVQMYVREELRKGNILELDSLPLYIREQLILAPEEKS
jgi:hypothetical protein